MTGSKTVTTLTIRTLRAGSAFAVTLLLAGLVLYALGSDIGARAALLGVLAMIATPALGLVATTIESWDRDRTAALLGVVVLGVLVVASGVALFVGR